MKTIPMYQTPAGIASQPARIRIRSARKPDAGPTGNRLLEQFERQDLRSIEEQAVRVTLVKGDTIARPGEDIPFVDFPIDAVVSHYQILKDGKTVEIAMTGREGALGVPAALRQGVSKEFSEVLVGGEVYRIDASYLRGLAERSANLRSVFFGYFNECLDRVSRRVICNNYHSVEERLCLWLMLVRDRCGVDSLPFTQEQVSFFLGVHRPSVTLAMQDLRKQGIVDYSRGTVHVRKPSALIELSCSCYSSLSVRPADAPGSYFGE
ncbi:MAG TPA: Crp/Fnr family transcriptional regulator [Aridibacter sp.]|nr:Crp/Fnr family transcriptional regulator [Aridibacter sp.]